MSLLRQDMTYQSNPKSLARAPQPDLMGQAANVKCGLVRAEELFAASLAAANSSAAKHVYVRRFDRSALANACAVDSLRDAGAPVPALAGLPISIKDLFDVAGQPTTAGSNVLIEALPAQADARCVARLRAAGATLTGHTNLSEFAFSGVGINPHHGTPANGAAVLRGQPARIPGGSSSGGAVSVACGAAFAALGSDTGGSIRIPAALQGLVGFKNTQRLTPNEGCIPLSTTLDTPCAMTLSVRDAILLHEILANRTVAASSRSPAQWRLAVPTNGALLDNLSPEVARAFELTLRRLRLAGLDIAEIVLPALDELPAINAQGTFAAAESYAWHQPHLATNASRYDPRVAMRIRQGATMTAAQYIGLHQARRRWIEAMALAMAGFDAMLSPTVPVTAPLLEPLETHDALFFETNRLLLRNPSTVNFLDGCALSLPCQEPGQMPVGLMVWAGAWRDDDVLRVSSFIENALALATT
jgi:aspartyl-tRNA(Asn)/glutamyl-tRNA(Gln) amidotransferase subunit A